MRWGNQTHWDADNETIEQWLAREHVESEKASNPTCPHCGYIAHDWYEYIGLSDWQVEDCRIDCGHCGKPFLCDKETQVRFECKKLESNPESK